MLTPLLAASALLLAAAPSGAPATPPAAAGTTAKAPARFASADFGFSAQFPCAASGGEVPGDGPVKTHVFMCGGQQKGETAFAISVMVPPAEGADQLASLDFVRPLLQGLAAQLAKGTNGKVAREGSVRADAVEGYEVVVEGAGGHGRFRAFPHQGRVYQVVAIGAVERAAEADTFVESFALDAR